MNPRRPRAGSPWIPVAILAALLPLPGCLINTLIGFVTFLVMLPFKLIWPLLTSLFAMGQKALPYVLLYGLFVGAPDPSSQPTEGAPVPPLLATALDPGLAGPAVSPVALVAAPFGEGSRADLVLAVPAESLADPASRAELAERLQRSGGLWRIGPAVDLVPLLREPTLMDRLLQRWLGEGATVVVGGPAGVLGPDDPLPDDGREAARWVRGLPLDPALVAALREHDVPAQARGVWAPDPPASR